MLILRFLYCKGDIKVISRHHYFTRKSDEKGNLRFLLTFSTAGHIPVSFDNNLPYLQ